MPEMTPEQEEKCRKALMHAAQKIVESLAAEREALELRALELEAELARMDGRIQ